MMPTFSNQTLVVGFGNPWRGDDRLGPAVARRIQAQGLPRVRVLVVHQLAPELAKELAAVDRAVFVDACRDRRASEVTVEPIAASGAHLYTTHVFDPRTLIALAQIVYGRAPQAWLVTIEGEQFEPGERLSSAARRRAQKAARHIERLLNRTSSLEEAP